MPTLWFCKCLHLLLFPSSRFSVVIFGLRSHLIAPPHTLYTLFTILTSTVLFLFFLDLMLFSIPGAVHRPDPRSSWRRRFGAGWNEPRRSPRQLWTLYLVRVFGNTIGSTCVIQEKRLLWVLSYIKAAVNQLTFVVRVFCDERTVEKRTSPADPPD